MHIFAYMNIFLYLCSRFLLNTMRKLTRILICPLLVAMLTTGCVTQKQLAYLSDADAAKIDSINSTFVSRSETIIRNGDALHIFVSALDKEAVAPYNLPAVTYTAPGTAQVQTTPMLQYYIVDASGDVEMPVLGKIHVAGLTRAEAAEAIKQKLEKQVVNPLVHLQLVDAKVSVLGEVNAPGRVIMQSDRMTILDALAAAGDLTPYGKRDNVMITREVNGKLEVAHVDLRSADLFKSPYYYLQHNDIVYVTPNKVRAVSSANAGLWLSTISTALSAATIVVTVVKK